METVSIVLVLLVAVVASAAVARMLRQTVPAPLVQIATGFAIGLVADVRVTLEPDLFFLLFLPPLLFLDGWRIPKDAARRDLPLIAELAIGLVIFTVVGAGFLFHWLFPFLPLAVCFALAAVLSPTDPIAVSAIAERVAVPPRMLHILEGESLLNDASGLVCLRFATAAAMTGAFSLADAAASFAWMGAAGLGIGVAATVGIAGLLGPVTRRFGAEPGSQILVTLLVPFGAYLLAEHVHASGILAAVGAGVAMTFVRSNQEVGADVRVRGNSVWDLVQFTLNGVIFVLLGEQLPLIFEGAVRAAALHDHGGVRLVLVALLVTLLLAALRFGWVWASLRFTLLRAREKRPFRSSDVRLVAAFSVGGVRGAITLAGILTLPLALPDGTPFPDRDFAIFLAAAVILVSLVAASIALPLLLNGLVLPPDDDAPERERDVREAIGQAAIRAVEAARADARDGEAEDHAAAARKVIAILQDRIEAADDGATARRRRAAVEREMRLVGLRASRAEAMRLSATGAAPSLLVRRIVREIDLMELRLAE